jgi:hypothetical protein
MNLTSAKRLAVVATVTVLVTAATAITGCAALRSDSANAGRQNARARSEALIANQIASREAAPAQSVTDDALRRLLSGNSHVNEYRRAVTDVKPYFTSYQYFRPDGAYIARDTYSRRADGYEAVGRWQVDHNVLCVQVSRSNSSPECYTIKVTAKGAIEYWIHKPGDPFHGLITASVNIIRPGLQAPEYVTTQEMYGR